MALCKRCVNYDKSYADLRKRFDDCVTVGGDQREKDFCMMYEDFIPLEITYENKECPFFMDRSDDGSQNH